ALPDGAQLYIHDLPNATTDADGRFRIPNAPAGPRPMMVQARGYAPALLDKIAVGPDLKPLEIRLETSPGFRARVVDDVGKPVEGARFHPDTWRGERTFDAFLYTDKDGRVAWDAAPREQFLANVYKVGYIGLTQVPVKAGAGEVTFTLKRALEIRGLVVD